MHIDIPGKHINAVAIGVPGFNLVGVTKAAREQLTSSELEAVLAHEHAHIIQLHSVVKIGIMIGLHRNLDKKLEEHTDLNNIDRMLVGTAITLVVTNSVSYMMERLADRYAIRLGHGPALVGAFTKMLPQEKWWGLPNAIFGGQLHPTLASRIRRCMK